VVRDVCVGQLVRASKIERLGLAVLCVCGSAGAHTHTHYLSSPMTVQIRVLAPAIPHTHNKTGPRMMVQIWMPAPRDAHTQKYEPTVQFRTPAPRDYTHDGAQSEATLLGGDETAV
jgi:hypothetical protein